MASPSLIIRRLRVDGTLARDVRFRDGMNVIVGESDPTDPRHSNACGKTTLVELIQCGLGRRYGGYGDFKELAAIKASVETLWLEIELNGRTLLIERSLRSVTGLLKLRWEPFREGIAVEAFDPASPEELSRVLLDALQIPEVAVKQADGSAATLTFQLLRRAFILHQEDSFLDLLDKVQPDARRTQIIGFLTKIRSLQAFALEEKVGEAQQRLTHIKERITQVSAFLAEHGVSNLTEAHRRVREVAEMLDNAKRAQRAIQYEIRDRRQQAAEAEGGRVVSIREQLARLDERERVISEQRSQMLSHVAELQALMGSLEVEERKLRRVRSSSELLSSVSFSTCPRCLQAITDEMQEREEAGRCCLCARMLATTSDANPRSIPNAEELQAQQSDTRELLRVAYRRISEGDTELRHIHTSRGELGRALDAEMQAFVSPAVDRLVAQSDAVAAQAAALGSAQTLLDQSLALDKLQQQVGPLDETYRSLSRQLAEAQRSADLQLAALQQEYGYILQAVDWEDFSRAEINARTLMPSINGVPHTGYGTAKKGVAVVAYHLAMLALARSHDTFMPRMLVIDSPAVGDLNERNHDALLRYLAALARGESPTDVEREADLLGDGDTQDDRWQIILTTRKMVPELEAYRLMNLRAPDRMLLQPRGEASPPIPSDGSGDRSATAV